MPLNPTSLDRFLSVMAHITTRDVVHDHEHHECDKKSITATKEVSKLSADHSEYELYSIP